MAERKVNSYSDFSGGMNVDVSPHLVESRELLLAKNLDFRERGAMKTRKGVMPLNPEPWSQDSLATHMFEWTRKNGEVWLLAVMDKNIYRIFPDGTRDPVSTVVGERLGYVVFQDKLYYLDSAGYWTIDDSGRQPVTPKDDPTNDLSRIKRCRFLIRHPKSFRFFAAGDYEDVSALYYSEPNEPDFWRETSRLTPSQEDGPVTGLALLGDAVLVLFRNAIWVWRGIDPDEDVIWERLSAPEGTEALGSVALTPLSLTFLGSGGLWAMSPAALGLSGEVETDETLFSNLSDHKMQSILGQIVQKDQVSSIYDPRKQRYMMAYTTSPQGNNDSILILDWTLKAFSMWEGIEAQSLLYSHDGSVLASIEGHIVRLEEGQYDFREGFAFPIEMEAITPPYDAAPMQPKRFLRLLVMFRKDTEESPELLCKVLVDGVLVKEVNLSEYVEYPDAPEPWGEIVTARIPINENGQRIQLRFSESTSMPVTFYGWAYEWSSLWRKGRQV